MVQAYSKFKMSDKEIKRTIIAQIKIMEEERKRTKQENEERKLSKMAKVMEETNYS